MRWLTASYLDAVLRAVNDSGDSDSTGSITGNLLGAALGTAALPTVWLDDLELRTVIEALAGDATLEFHGDAPVGEHNEVADDWWDRYPGWSPSHNRRAGRDTTRPPP